MVAVYYNYSQLENVEEDTNGPRKSKKKKKSKKGGKKDSCLKNESDGSARKDGIDDSTIVAPIPAMFVPPIVADIYEQNMLLEKKSSRDKIPLIYPNIDAIKIDNPVIRVSGENMPIFEIESPKSDGEPVITADHKKAAGKPRILKGRYQPLDDDDVTLMMIESNKFTLSPKESGLRVSPSKFALKPKPSQGVLTNGEPIQNQLNHKYRSQIWR
ncbi:uncharacterized protein LOC135927450 isoform X2 [Gordionus sp. m RMFG-2023]|uniref:uncharacterized protein LOC135927450 isoform X2 n=1 Tax=Gordionus sp. m RMFG-2023 TaxID=3053472 RepID=UPI0031FC2D8D